MLRELAGLVDRQVLGGVRETMTRLAVATGIAERNGCAKTFITSASRKRP